MDVINNMKFKIKRIPVSEEEKKRVKFFMEDTEIKNGHGLIC